MPSHPMSPASCSASAARQASRRGALLALATMAWSVCTLAAEAPAEPPKGAEEAAWRRELPAAKVLGRSEFRWRGFKLYDATLWSAAGRWGWEQPFALQLRYARSLSGSRLASTSIEEIRRIEPDRHPEAVLDRWSRQLQESFLDVKEGDELVAVYLPGQGLKLFTRESLRATWRDEQLARSFLGIWFHEATRDPASRRRLLGLEPAK
ncbi:MAG: hypothetical protein E6Q92_01105 [Burkholderiaceae bacterium]|nr:MAG: hypothetical protein E6Q92_01105 [Burkholderiaceae bacterium]